MLIRVKEHSPTDLETWELKTRQDALVARTALHRRRVDRARSTLLEFAELGNCYAGVSWGKDSVCLAHLIATCGVSIPVVYVAVWPLANPHNLLVRDAFLAVHDVDYHEIHVSARPDDAGEWHASGVLEDGFRLARVRWGSRYVSGIRGQESAGRRRRMASFGATTETTCAPLGWWEGSDVFAYLHAHDLPVHPAYAMSMDGLLDRERLRVSSLTLRRGDGMGRAEWERRYYGWRLADMRAMARRACQNL